MSVKKKKKNQEWLKQEWRLWSTHIQPSLIWWGIIVISESQNLKKNKNQQPPAPADP